MGAPLISLNYESGGKGVCVPPVACRPAEHLPRREREIVKARSGERRPRVSDVAALSGNGLFARGTRSFLFPLGREGAWTGR